MYVLFRNLRQKYGPDTVDSTSNDLKENQLTRELVMKNQDRFAGFLGEFDTEWDRLKTLKDSEQVEVINSEIQRRSYSSFTRSFQGSYR